MKINKINILLISSVLIIGCSREQEKGNDDSSTNTAQSITNSDFSYYLLIICYGGQDEIYNPNNNSITRSV